MLELLAPLDYPRQAAANLARGAGRLLGGEATLQDALGMVPGVAGLAAAPFLSPLGGAAVAGGLQGLGRMTGMEAFDAPDPGALVEALGGDPESSIQGMAAALASDPLTYAGASVPWWMKFKPKGIPLDRAVRGFQASQIERQAAAYAAEEAARLARAPQESEILRALQADAAASAAREGMSPAGPFAGAMPADFNAAQPYVSPGYPEWATPIEAQVRPRGSPPHAPLTGPLPDQLPMSLTPEQFELELDRMYRLASEYQREGFPELLRGSPERAMMIGADLTNDILNAEAEFLRRAHHSGEAWMPPKLYKQIGSLGNDSRAWRLAREHHENLNFAPGTVQESWVRTHQGLDGAGRTFTPEQALFASQRYHDALAERDLLPFMDIPGADTTVAGAMEHASPLTRALNRQIAGGSLPWLDRGQIPAPLRNVQARGIGDLHMAIDNQIRVPNDVSNQQYMEGIGEAGTMLFQPGNITPAQAQEMLNRLRNTGYPMSGERYGDFYRQRKLSDLLFQMQYPDVTPIPWPPPEFTPGPLAAAAPSAEAQLLPILHQQLGTQIYGEALPQFRDIFRRADAAEDPLLNFGPEMRALLEKILAAQKF